MKEELKENILQPSQWIRVLYMVLFFIICWVIEIVLIVVVIGQALFSIITGKDNENLRSFGKSLSYYIYQILQFLTYNSEQKPFPFSDWPASEEDDDEELDLSANTSENDDDVETDEVETEANSEVQASSDDVVSAEDSKSKENVVTDD